MNEPSVVNSLLRQVKDVAEDHPEDHVKAIRIRIGQRAHVDPRLLLSAYDKCVQGTSLGGARLCMKRAPPQARCDQCGYRFQLDGSLLECEKCGSLRLTVEESEDVYVESIKFEEDSTMSKET